MDQVVPVAEDDAAEATTAEIDDETAAELAGPPVQSPMTPKEEVCFSSSTTTSGS